MTLFEWNESKRQRTLKLRGLDFAEAHKVFEDDYALFAPDLRYDYDDRWLVIGELNKNRIVVISYKEVKTDTYRIISMRKAEKRESTRYLLEIMNHLPSTNESLNRLFNQLKDSPGSEEDQS
jgi:uncharacterized DUF497 family protein